MSLSNASCLLAPPILIGPLPLVAPFLMSTLAGCHVTSYQAAASCLPAPPPPITPPPLIVPLLRLLSGWLLHHLVSRPHASFLAGCHVASCYATTSHPPAPPPLIALLPLIAPLLTPLVCLAVMLPFVIPPPPVRLCINLSLHPTPHRAPLAPCVQQFVASLLVTPLSPIRLRLRLSLHPSWASCPADCCVTSRHAATASCCLASTSHCAVASHHTPLVPLVWLVVTTMISLFGSKRSILDDVSLF